MTRSAEILRLATVGTLAGMLLAGCSSNARKPTSTSAPAATPPAQAAHPAPATPGADKGDPDERFKAALALMKDKQNQEAQDAFVALAKDYPEFSGPLTNLGIVLANAKKRPEAIAGFQRAVKANPKNALAYNWLGTLARENSDYALAERSYQSAIAAKADYAAPHLNLGLLYDVYLKRPSDALVQYREYQRITGGERLIVSAWIKELEVATAPPPAPAAAAPQVPAATAPLPTSAPPVKPAVAAPVPAQPAPVAAPAPRPVAPIAAPPAAAAPAPAPVPTPAPPPAPAPVAAPVPAPEAPAPAPAPYVVPTVTLPANGARP